MLFVTGNPNLVTQTQRLGGQSANASGTLYATQETKDAINLAYEWLWNHARRLGVGWGVDYSYANSVANQVYYTQPTDVGGKLISVGISLVGDNLSTGTTNPVTYPQPSSHDVALAGWESNNISTEGAWYFFEYGNTNKRIGIVAPPTTAGTNSIQFVYEEELTLLSADGDEPLIPKAFHQLICYQAAIDLRISKGLDINELQFQLERRMKAFEEHVAEPVFDPEYQIPTVGRATSGTYSIQTGFMRR